MTLTELHNFLGEHLADIAEVLPHTYKLTLVARYTGAELADADVVIGDDDLTAAVAAIERLACRQPHNSPPSPASTPPGGDDA